MNNVLLVGPSVEPVTLAEMKAQLNIDTAYTDDDTHLNAIISSARQWLEDRTSQCFIKQQRAQYMECFDDDEIEIIRGPVLITGAGVSEPVVKYYDSNDQEQTWDSSNYWLDLRALVPQIVPKYSWPSTSGHRPNGISVTYYAGYGVDATNVPVNIKHAIKVLGTHLYNNRQFEIEGRIVGKLEFDLERLISFETRLQYAG